MRSQREYTTLCENQIVNIDRGDARQTVELTCKYSSSVVGEVHEREESKGPCSKDCDERQTRFIRLAEDSRRLTIDREAVKSSSMSSLEVERTVSSPIERSRGSVKVGVSS